MGFRIGDTVFTSSAAPATVVGKEEGGSAVRLDRDFDAFQTNTRHGLHNDMAPEDREQFNDIMDEIRSTEGDAARVETLLAVIDDLKSDPRKGRLITYLDGEVRHLMHTKGIKPRFFTTDAFKVR